MKILRYSHERMLSLAEVGAVWLYRAFVRVIDSRRPEWLRGRRRRRHLTAAFVVLVIVVEAVLLYTLAELIGLCISLFELYVELAAKHLEITLDHT